MTTGRTFIDRMDPALRAALAVPALSLPKHGWLTDQETKQELPFDPFRLTDDLQQTIIAYVSDPPRDANGAILWLNVLGSRQTGKSLTGELAFYPIVAYTPGHSHVCVADVKWRADELHLRTQFCHKRWPDNLKAKTQKGEVRQITFEHDSRMKVLSAESEGVGVGMSFDSFHGSELALWDNASQQFSMLNPAMINRKNAFMLNECTPFPLSTASAPFWKDKYEGGKMRRGREISAFFPMWDGKLNRRPWPKGEKPDSEEERLLRKYGCRQCGPDHPRIGCKNAVLTLENLAFRRLMLETDVEIRRNHDLFQVFYPFDDLTCWISAGRHAIPHRVIHRHTDRSVLVPWGASDTHIRYITEPNPNAVYVIGCDPAGYAGRDHCSWQCFEVWDDEWRQASSFATVCDPELMTEKLIEEGMFYNKALIGVERNQGGGPLALLRAKGYPNLYYDRSHQPGVWKSDEQEFVSILIDALLDKLTIFDEDLVSQLLGYQQDRMTQRSLKAEVMNPDRNRGRRDRHHWDKVSALMVLCAIAPDAPRRHKIAPKPANVHVLGGMTWEQMQAYEKRLAGEKEAGEQTRARYTRTRRR